MEWPENVNQKWMKDKKPLKTEDKKSYGDSVKESKGNNTTSKESKSCGSA